MRPICSAGPRPNPLPARANGPGSWGIFQGRAEGPVHSGRFPGALPQALTGPRRWRSDRPNPTFRFLRLSRFFAANPPPSGTGLLTRGFGETAPARNRTITERETRATWSMAHGFSTGQSRPPSLTRRPRPARSPPEQQHRSDNPSAAMKLSTTKRGPRAGRLRKSGATKREKKSPGYGRTKPSGRSPPSPGSHPSPSRRSPNFVPSHTRNANAQNYGVPNYSAYNF